MSEAVFMACGGRPVLPQGALMMGEVHPDDVSWNFGVAPKPESVTRLIQAAPSLHAKFPKLAGRWDGKTSINHHDAVRKALGKDIRAQYQVRGTCGGRAGSQGMNVLQCVLMVSKSSMRIDYKNVSHAGVYYAARKKYGMLSGSWQNDSNDGVAGGSVPEILASTGVVYQEEDGDTNYYGPGSDDLACQLGAGMKSDLARKIEELAKDNIVTEWAPCKSAQECADGLMAGGVIIQSDSQGYAMQRDSEGFCATSRQPWAHYQIRTGVRVTPRGRKGFDYNQSWGDTTPSGPLLDGCPGNCFGVDYDVQDHLCRSGEVAVIFGFEAWLLEAAKVDVTWMF